MKKLMILASVALSIVVAHAAGYSWKSSTMSGGTLYDGTSASTLYATAGATTLYLFMIQATDTAGTAGSAYQSSIFSSLANKTDISTLGAYTTTALSSDSKVTTKEWTDAGQSGKTYDMFFATVFENGEGNDAFYLSTLKAAMLYGDTTTKSVSWGDLYSTSITTLDAGGGWKGAGVYESVPEPFSGTLALLGMAGIALRRKLKKAKKA